jgi:maleylpyruvate isomerase
VASTGQSSTGQSSTGQSSTGQQREIPAGAAEWAAAGTAAFGTAAATADLAGPSGLPGWRRAHVVAHVAHHADALVNLLNWARTGVETPMYASPEERAEGIEADSGRAAADLLADLAAAADRYAAAAALPAAAWSARVRNAQGADIPAAVIPWMRARETWVHAVDLAADVTFADVPRPVTETLLDEVTAGYAGPAGWGAAGPAVLLRAAGSDRSWVLTPDGDSAGAAEVAGDIASLAAYVTGRPVPGVLRASGGGAVPVLPAWL